MYRVARCRQVRHRRVAGRGFTLIELVMVIVLVGVLAVFVAPRFDASDVGARGFHDETLALLRFAQKTAIAQRRVVCVSFIASSASLRIASAGGVYTCDTDLRGPRGESPASINARSGVAYTTLPGSFGFDALGQPVSASGGVLASQTLQVANLGKTVTVEAATGYVHD